MMRRNEESCRLFQTEKILHKNGLFSLVPSPERNDRMWNRFSLRKRCDALFSGCRESIVTCVYKL